MNRPCVALLLTPLFMGCSGDPEASDHVALELGRRADPIVEQIGPDYVVTPNGYWHKSCVHDVGNGAFLGKNGHVKRPDGTEHDLPVCAYPHYSSHQIQRKDDAVKPTVNSWVTWAQRNSSLGYKNLVSFWTVPAKPTNEAGQVVFFFPGLWRYDRTRIIQPVLQYGNNGSFGGNYWTIASWSCDDGSVCPHSSPIAVSVGDEIQGHIAGSNCSNGVCDYQIVTKDDTTGHLTYMNWNADVKYTYAVVALEAYSVSSCNEYPNQDQKWFSTSVTRTDGTEATGNWGAVTNPVNPLCGAGTTSPSYQSVTLHWTP